MLAGRASRNNSRTSLEVSTTNLHLLCFLVRNANSAGDGLHVSFGNRLTNGVINSSLLVLLNCTTNVRRDLLLMILFDATLNGVVDRSLLHFFYRTLNCVVNRLVSCLANRSLYLIFFSATLCFANRATYWNLYFFVHVFAYRSVTSNLLLLVYRSLDGLHNRIATAVSGCRCSLADGVVACSTTTLGPAEAG